MNAIIESQIVMTNNNPDWSTLEHSLAQGNVIPVIGPDALVVEISDSNGITHTVPFYRLIARELLDSFQITPEAQLLESTWAVHKAVDSILVKNLAKEAHIRRIISQLIAKYSEQVQL